MSVSVLLAAAAAPAGQPPQSYTAWQTGRFCDAQRPHSVHAHYHPANLPANARYTPPKLLEARQPAWPAVPHARGGTVELGILVTSRGRAEYVGVLAPSGEITLDRSAKRTVLGAKFAPASLDDVPVTGCLVVRVVFKMASSRQAPG